MSLSFTSEDSFRSSFPSAALFVKDNAADSPCIGIKVSAGRTADVPKAGWVSPWADISNPICSGTKLVLVNTPVGECYACEIAPNGAPVGYRERAVQNIGNVVAYATRSESSPLLAFPVLSGTVKVNGVAVGEGQVIFARLQDGTLGVVDANKLADMPLESSGLFTSDAVVYDSEPVWATEPLDAPFTYEGLEGVKVAPAGSRLAFSETKNLYFITEAKWVKMGYAAVA